MTKEPYHVCVASTAVKDLEQILENGAKNQVKEGRRWTGAIELQKQAALEDRPFVVVFSDPENLSELLYFAELGKIKIHRTKDETAFEVLNLERFTDPKPRKTELFSHLDESDSQDRPHIFCKTPPELLEAKRDKSAAASKEISTRNVRSELYHVIHQESLRRVRSESELLFDVRTDFIQHLENDGYTVDEEMIDEMRQDCRNRESNRLASHLRHYYGLDVAKEEIAQCETVENFVELVKAKLMGAPKEIAAVEQPAETVNAA